MKTLTMVAVAMAVGLAWGISVSADTIYNQAVLADSPMDYWTFDEASGSALDQVGTKDLTASGGGVRVASTSNAGGISLGSAADFNSTEATAFVKTGAGWGGATSYAIEMWIRATVNGASYAMDFERNKPAVIYGYVSGTMETFGNGARVAGPNLSDAEWHYVLLGVTPTTVTWILDGGSPATSANSGSGLVLTNGGFVVGGAYGDTPGAGGITGQIDEVAVYDLGAFEGSAFQSQLLVLQEHYSVTESAIPEPATLLLVGTGALGVFGFIRRQRMK